jgi:hypothetical protein
MNLRQSRRALTLVDESANAFEQSSGRKVPAKP